MTSLLELRQLKKYYPIYGGVFKRRVASVRAVDGVSLSVEKGECFGLVGESGCGKTTLGKTVLRLLRPDAGSIYFGVPVDVTEQIDRLAKKDPSSLALRKLRRKYDIATYLGMDLRRLRRRMQIVYQDPTTSLDPRMLVKDVVGESLYAQGLAKGEEARKMVMEILERVGMSERALFRFPHEFSGGQRQRIAIARALVSHPEFVILDEPTSAVDVSVRAQLLNLFQDLQKEFGLTYMFISHDLGIVECISDRVGIMYLGKIVEYSSTEQIFHTPLHPYSQALIASVPIPDPTRRKERAPLTGEVPSPVNPPLGCRFHPRCPLAMDICKKVEPQLLDAGNGHFVACYAVSQSSGG
jgi:oligopeptide/dipeptide ABC transporter ATP-binding protein